MRLTSKISITASQAPGGSLSGSAVGVSAGFSPLSIGTEADGSLVTPVSRAALYGLKPTVGSVVMDVIFVISRFFDVAGALAKTVTDLALLMEHMLDDDVRKDLPEDGYTSFWKTEWTDLEIGLIEPSDWTLPPALVEPNEEVHAQTVIKPSLLRSVLMLIDVRNVLYMMLSTRSNH